MNELFLILIGINIGIGLMLVTKFRHEFYNLLKGGE